MIDKTRLILWCMAAVIPILGFGEEASAEPKAGGRVVITYGGGTPRRMEINRLLQEYEEPGGFPEVMETGDANTIGVCAMMRSSRQEDKN